MRANGLFVRKKRKCIPTTNAKHNYPIAPNLLSKEFDVEKENQVKVSVITYIDTKQYWVYLTVVIVLFHPKNNWLVYER
ncbi:hypothetical protein SAMN05421797_107154 [Maribacter ulvicola]|uniref:Transposase n=1 Tax=Maribacter ulvicola TaxID=228959 RepID=A0A1N6YV47_9FLAO|nr:hypothetical protein SAMN05421797_107154 [Maribacter ulvicola]